MSTSTVTCIECAGAVPVPADVMVGEILACPDCGAELEVQALTPEIIVGLAPAVQEDWGE